VRDVAYGSLLRDHRQRLHGRIAEVCTLRRLSRWSPKCWAFIIARPVWSTRQAHTSRAGDCAAARSAYIEAVAHFRAAIEEADRLPQKDERARRALTLLPKLGPAIALTIGEWKPEFEAVYRRARDLGREVDDGPKQFRATWGLWFCASRTTARRRKHSSRGATLSLG
jgi:hypothetical protein